MKRRATLALAHDVKCWNAHRKREILQTALSYAKSQHEATRRAVDAWSCLRDGYVGSTIIPSTQARRAPPPKPRSDIFSSDDAETTIYARDNDSDEQPTIIAVDHELLRQSAGSLSIPNEGPGGVEPETLLPLVVASPIPEEDDDELGSSRGALDEFGLDSEPHATASFAQTRSSSTFSGTGSGTAAHPKASMSQQGCGSGSYKPTTQSEDDNEILTSSMQSLVDGLMNWGGQYDEEEDLALPTGMAASIALEESGVLGSHSKLI